MGRFHRSILSIRPSFPPRRANAFSRRSLAREEQAEVISGREAYHQRYVQAFSKVAASAGGVQVIFLGAVRAGLAVPPGEVWDEVALVEYKSFEAFRSIIESPAYVKEAEPHRRAALEDWRLLALQKI